MNRPSLRLDPDYPRVKRLIIERTGLAYFEEKDEDLSIRIRRRLTALGLSDCASYLRALGNGVVNEPEMDALIAELTIGETYFFRQIAHFDALREVVLPDLIERQAARRELRIWSAGCATGPEAYSVSMLLRTAFADRIAGWNVSILGTDINRAFLASAREAVYSDWAFRECPPAFKQRCFRHEGKRWSLRPEFKEGVSFMYHNLATGSFAPLGRFDLILCRNVTIYFGPVVIQATADRFHECLTEGGWLLVGHAEPSPATYRAFRRHPHSQVTLYQRAEPGAEPLLQGLIGLPAVPTLPAPSAPAASRHEGAKPAAAPIGLDEVRRLADRGEWRAAAAGCRALLKTDRLSAAVHFTYGLIQEHTGALTGAERSLRQAIYLKRDFALAHHHLGVCLLRSKHARQARRAFANVLDLLKDTPDAEVLEHGDGITAADLKELARMNVEAL
jgi:chemotaxis protein methyltransferase CheR